MVEDDGSEEPAEAAEVGADEEHEDHDPQLRPPDDLEIKVYRMVVLCHRRRLRRWSRLQQRWF